MLPACTSQYVSQTATVRQSRSQSSSSSRPAHTSIMVLTSIENIENLNLGHPRLQDKNKEEQSEKEYIASVTVNPASGFLVCLFLVAFGLILPRTDFS